MKQFSIIFALIVLVGIVAVYFLIQAFSSDTNVSQTQDNDGVVQVDDTEDSDSEDNNDQTEPDEEDTTFKPETTIGTSVDGNDITAYHFGTGEKELLFIGGIHGGYSWNTVLVAYELVDYLNANPDAVPEDVRVTVVPVLNPDGLSAVVDTTGRFTAGDVPASESIQVAGRFNANTVDLNRNFDCDWQSDGTWQQKAVDGGSKAFSEPESQAVRDYVEKNQPEAVVAWYSAAGGVFASNCHNGVLPETLTLTNLYSKASGYKAYEEFDFYEVTGDMVNWFAKNKIPAISILLTTHTSVEWDKNKSGIEALLKYYSE